MSEEKKEVLKSDDEISESSCTVIDSSEKERSFGQFRGQFKDLSTNEVDQEITKTFGMK